MSATTKTPVTKLAPVECKTEAAAKKLASADGRKRGILAINEHGVLVVCCRRTAKKNGWSVQEVMYKKTTPTPEPVVAAEPVKAPAKPRTKKPKNSELL